MSQAHVSCTYVSFGGLILPGGSEEAQTQVIKDVIQNFDFLTTSAFKMKKVCYRVETSMV